MGTELLGPVASVLIPCKGHAKELARCLESLEGQQVSFPYETLVIDSAIDPQVEAVTAGFERVDLERGGRGLLAGEARNLGAERARGEYLVFIDADCRAEPGWLASAVKGLEGGAVMVGGPVLDARPWHPVAVTDNLLQFTDFPRSRRSGPARYFPGCNMAMRRGDFLSIGGFPKVRWTAGEDTALCERVLEHWPRGLAFVGGMRVLHEGRSEFFEFLRHQASFGRARGALGLHLTDPQVRWGSRRLATPAVVAKRLSYIVGRQVTWNAIRSLRLIPLAPLIVVGLVAWAEGFRRGCRERMRSGQAADAPTPAKGLEERG